MVGRHSSKYQSWQKDQKAENLCLQMHPLSGDSELEEGKIISTQVSAPLKYLLHHGYQNI